MKANCKQQSTLAQYHGIWRTFNKFLIRLDDKLQTWEERLIYYVGYCTSRGVKSTTIKSYISAIKHVLQVDGYHWNMDQALLSTLTSSCRLKNDRVRNRLPIQKRLMELILFELERKFETQPYLQVMYQTIFCIAYYGMLRIGEITTGNHPILAKNVYVNKQHLKLCFVLYTSKTHGLESKPQKIRLTALKTTDRFLKCTKTKSNNFFCPVDLTNNYMQLRGDYVNDDDPLFIFKDQTPVQPKHVRRILHQVIGKLGLKKKLYNTHSFRSGRATDLLKQGYTVDQIKRQGRWRSNAVYNYFKD